MTAIQQTTDWRELIQSASDAGFITDDKGRELPFHSGLSLVHYEALHSTVKNYKPKVALEVGMACGVSTLAILSALEPDAKLISIDPFQYGGGPVVQDQHIGWQGAGMLQVERAGFASQHQLIEEFDYLALPDLFRAGARIDFAYLDGPHSFEYNLMEIWFLSRMQPVGGVIGFNDCNLQCTQKALRWFKTHRRYDEIDVGLKPDYQGRNLLYGLARWVLRRSNSDRYFIKREDWEPGGGYHRHF